MSRRVLASLFALLVLSAATATGDDGPVLWTGVTGTITSSGLENPRYVLSFPPLQRMMLRAATGGVTRDEVLAALEDTPVTLQTLLDLELLAPAGDGYRVGYLLLTAKDQEEIFRISNPLADDLTQKILAHRAEFDALLASYPDDSLRKDLAFGLIAGFLLNWEGLDLSSTLGYRVEPKTWPNGDRYVLHSSEFGAELPEQGLYSGSHTFPGGDMLFSTFGDGTSIPRIHSLPDVYEPVFEAGLTALEVDVDLLAATRSHLLTYLMVAVEDAGQIMRALAASPATVEQLAEETEIAAPRVAATVGLLQAVGYVEDRDGVLRNAVVVLTEEHRALVDSTLALGRKLLTDWLTQNFSRIEGSLAGLSPMQNGLPFQLAFSEIWHYIFGLATGKLAAAGFYADPRSEDSPFDGFVPLVFDAQLHASP